MPKSFSCPTCGAPLDYEGSDELTIACPYCHNSVIVPEELRPHAAGRAEELREIVRLARAGKKIEAIKLYRSTFDVGLREAKEVVERFAAGGVAEIVSTEVKAPSSDRVSVSEPLPGGATVIGCSTWWIWLLAGVVFLALILLPIFVDFSAIKEDLQSAFTTQTMTPTRTPFPAPTQPTSPTPLPGFARAVLTFGGKGTGPGLFTNAHGIGVDGSGNIYVSDWEGGRVQVFDSDGKFANQWFVGDSKTRISSLAADRRGNVYLVAGGKILRYEGATGKLLGEWQYPDGDRFYSIAMTADGGLLATWYEQREGIITSIQGHRDDLVRFNSEGKVIWVIRGIISSQTEDPELDNYPAIDGLGNLFIVGGEFETAVFKFTPEGKFVTRFSSKGDEPGQLNHPRAIAVDNQSRVYVADSKGILVFDANGRYLDMFKADGTIYQMVFNDKNELFAVTGTQVMKFSLNK